MPGKFQFQKFSEIALSDSFFDSLKEDYPEFPQWFQRKADDGSTALVFSDDEGLGAFIYLKHEVEEIKLVELTLPAIPRKKIGTLKLADRYQGQVLCLSQEEWDEMLDLAGRDRNETAPDLPEYIMDKDIPHVRVALRKATSKGLGDEFWKDVADSIDKKE